MKIFFRITSIVSFICVFFFIFLFMGELSYSHDGEITRVEVKDYKVWMFTRVTWKCSACGKYHSMVDKGDLRWKYKVGETKYAYGDETVLIWYLVSMVASVIIIIYSISLIKE